MIQELEESSKRILAQHGYPEDCIGIDHETMPEVAYYAHRILSHLWQARHWMQQNVVHATLIGTLIKQSDAADANSEPLKNMSITMHAAIREVMNAMYQVVFLKNSEIGENYERGEKILKSSSIGGQERAANQKFELDNRKNQILIYARKLLENGDNRRNIASIIANNIHKKCPETFSKGLTSKTIRKILKEAGF